MWKRTKKMLHKIRIPRNSVCTWAHSNVATMYSIHLLIAFIFVHILFFVLFASLPELLYCTLVFHFIIKVNDLQIFNYPATAERIWISFVYVNNAFIIRWDEMRSSFALNKKKRRNKSRGAAIKRSINTANRLEQKRSMRISDKFSLWREFEDVVTRCVYDCACWFAILFTSFSFDSFCRRCSRTILGI